MRAFFAMAWDGRCKEAAASAARLRSRIAGPDTSPENCLRTSSFELYELTETPDRTSILPLRDETGEVSGAIFGTLFQRAGPSCPAIPAPVSAQVKGHTQARNSQAVWALFLEHGTEKLGAASMAGTARTRDGRSFACMAGYLRNCELSTK